MSISDQVLVFKPVGTHHVMKKPYLITAHFHKASHLLVFSLIDCENKFFSLKQSRKETLVVEEHPRSYFTPFVCTAITIERHKVTKDLIACFAGDTQFEIVVIDQASQFGKVVLK